MKNTPFYVLTSFLSLASLSASARDAADWIGIGVGVGGSLIGGRFHKAPPRPSDWRVSKLSVEDTRYPVGHKKRKACDRELIELQYSANRPQRGTILLIPGFMENAHTWDLIPSQGVSYARWLMREKGLKVYMLHIRGVGQSCYPSKSNLDDMAIDDVPAAIAAVSAREGKQNFLVMGHSMGGIALQASMAGLDRCGDVNCFKPEISTARQALVDGIAVEGSNVEFTLRDKELGLKISAKLEKLMMFMPGFLFDRISADPLKVANNELDGVLEGTKVDEIVNALRDPLFHFLFWRYFYSAPNVSSQTSEIFKALALDATNRGTLEQYSVAIRKTGMRATNGEKYSDHLASVSVPVAQAAFERDVFADWEFTKPDNFDRLGSTQKRYFTYPKEGHQDFMLNPSFHDHQSELIEWLLQAAAAN